MPKVKKASKSSVKLSAKSTTKKPETKKTSAASALKSPTNKALTQKAVKVKVQKAASPSVKNAKTSAKSAASKNLFKKATLGLTAATMLAGAGSSPAQAGYFTDALGGAFQDVGAAAKAGVRSTLKAASMPFALIADLGGWAKRNPRTAAGVATLAAVGTAAVAWYGLSQVDQSEESQGVLSGLAKTASDWMAPTGKRVEDFFGGSQAYSQANEAFQNLVSQIGNRLASADIMIKDAAGFVQSQNANGASALENAKGMAAQMAAAAQANGAAALENAKGMAAQMAAAAQANGATFMESAQKMAAAAQANGAAFMESAQKMAAAAQAKGATALENAKGMALKASEDRMMQGAILGTIASQTTNFLQNLRKLYSKDS
jgi:hypothetical protein